MLMKRISLVCHIIFYAFGIILPSYAITRNLGIMHMHIALICASVFSLVLYIIYAGEEDEAKRSKINNKRKLAAKIRKYVKKISHIYMLLTTAYAIVFTATDFSFMSLLFLIFIILVLVTYIAFSLLIWKFKKKLRPLREEYKNFKLSMKK